MTLLLNDSSEGLDELFIDDELSKIGITKLIKILSVLGAFVCLIGMIGNLFSIIILNRKSMKKLSTYTYLLGLSICDEINLTLTLLIMFHYILPTNLKINIFLKIALIYIYPIVNSLQALSVWITLAFTVDRYIFICHPYIGHEFCKRKRAFIVLGCLFLIAIVYCIPLFLEKTYIEVEILNTKQIFHTYSKLGQNKYFIYIYHLFIYSTFVFFVPFILIIVLNLFLVIDIIKSNKRHRELNIYSKPSIVVTSASIRKSTTTRRSSFSLIRKTSKNKLMPFLDCLRRSKNLNKNSEETINMEGIDANEPCLSQNGIKSASENNFNNLISVNSFNNSVKLSEDNSTSNNNNQNKISFSTTITQNFTDHTIRNDVGIMLAGLILVFLVCQLPPAILRLITFRNLSIYFQPVYYSSLDVSNFLVVCNSTINCILYVMLGRKFRREFLKLFCNRCLKNSSQSNRTSARANWH